MKNNLKLVSNEYFGKMQADIYSDENEMYMTAKQLGECLEYSNPVIAINKLVARNEYIKTNNFSVVTKLVSTDGKSYNTRLFNEDGIYEITMLAHTDKAKEFRCWVRQILKGLRAGELKISKASEEKNVVPVYPMCTEWGNTIHKKCYKVSKALNINMGYLYGMVYNIIEKNLELDLNEMLDTYKQSLRIQGVCNSKINLYTRKHIVNQDEILMKEFDYVLQSLNTDCETCLGINNSVIQLYK